ncbi:unnamed protein product [Protopolystoma xenopodis]|uniref:Uncharacterized protein n=1 Tax=Protopolystoma xenopodis TaxID=117903 RepID=A0A448WPG1_9PLAT|nr:unnamed protein product [Protopolystoma xenopodis]
MVRHTTLCSIFHRDVSFLQNSSNTGGTEVSDPLLLLMPILPPASPTKGHTDFYCFQLLGFHLKLVSQT